MVSLESSFWVIHPETNIDYALYSSCDEFIECKNEQIKLHWTTIYSGEDATNTLLFI